MSPKETLTDHPKTLTALTALTALLAQAGSVAASNGAGYNGP